MNDSTPPQDQAQGSQPSGVGPVIDPFARRVWMVVGIVLLVVVGMAVLWDGRDVFLLLFASILLAIFFRGLGDLIHRATGLHPTWSVGAGILLLFVLIATALGFMANEVADQTDQLVDNLPKVVENLEVKLAKYPWGRKLVEWLPSTQEWMPPASNLLGRATGILSTTFGLVGNMLVLAALGIFLALHPQTYVRGMVRLVPPRKRERAEEVFRALGYTLHWWLIGRLSAMTAVGVLTGLGLWLLDIPFFLPLTLITMVLGFVPYFGPLIAMILPSLIGFTISPTWAGLVVLLYLLIQTLESYLLTPLIQERAIAVPPAISIASLLLWGVLLGPMGLILGMPLTASVFVLVKMLYLVDVLEDDQARQDPAMLN